MLFGENFLHTQVPCPLPLQALKHRRKYEITKALMLANTSLMDGSLKYYGSCVFVNGKREHLYAVSQTQLNPLVAIRKNGMVDVTTVTEWLVWLKHVHVLQASFIIGWRLPFVFMRTPHIYLKT